MTRQFRRAAKSVGIVPFYRTRIVSDAGDTGYSNSTSSITGWWHRDYFLGRNAEEAYRSLPCQRGDPIPAKRYDVVT
jgi:hypothetical protein